MILLCRHLEIRLHRVCFPRTRGNHSYDLLDTCRITHCQQTRNHPKSESAQQLRNFSYFKAKNTQYEYTYATSSQSIFARSCANVSFMDCWTGSHVDLVKRFFASLSTSSNSRSVVKLRIPGIIGIVFLDTDPQPDNVAVPEGWQLRVGRLIGWT